jgi:hypothetical protein
MTALLEPLIPLMQEAPDSTAASISTAYDSIWANPGAAAASGPFEQVMLSDDKLFVVLGVVLIIWIGLILLLIRNDRRLRELERTVEENIPENDPF